MKLTPVAYPFHCDEERVDYHCWCEIWSQNGWQRINLLPGFSTIKFETVQLAVTKKPSRKRFKPFWITVKSTRNLYQLQTTYSLQKYSCENFDTRMLSRKIFGRPKYWSYGQVYRGSEPLRYENSSLVVSGNFQQPVQSDLMGWLPDTYEHKANEDSGTLSLINFFSYFLALFSENSFRFPRLLSKNT